MPPPGYEPIPAVSLSMEPANISAIANDVGTELIFQRQLIAQARPNDVAIAISTSGGSKNIVMALEEARKRKLLTVALLGYDGSEVALEGWDLKSLDFLFIENVGNLVCPSSYDLDEELRFVLLSVAEGEDKPLKYPIIFNSAKTKIFKVMRRAIGPPVPIPQRDRKSL